MRRQLVLVLLIVLFVVANTAGAYFLLPSRRSMNVWDFQPLWQAGRWIFEGRGDPYSEKMTSLLQQRSYGRPAKQGEDDRAFVYPLYVLLLMLPMLFMPLPLAQAAWFTTLEFAGVVAIVGSMRLTRRRGRPLQILLMVLWGFLLYPVVWALALGQVSIVIGALFVVALLALQADRGGWAGICLALTTAKPQMSFLLVPGLLFWALSKRRYRFLVSFAAAMAVFVLLSFAALPGWLGGVLRAGRGYFAVQPFSPPVALLGSWVGGTIGRALTALVLALLLVTFARAWLRRRDGDPPPVWAAGLTLAITALVAPRTSIVNQASLVLPLLLLLTEMARLDRPGRQVAAVLAIALLAAPWIVDLLWLPALNSGEHWHVQHRVLSPILPTVLLVGLSTWPWWSGERLS